MGVAATGTYGSLFRKNSAAGFDPRWDPVASPVSDTTAKTSKAVSVDLSEQAKAALAGANPPVTFEVPKSLDEIIQKRSEALAAKLTEAFAAFGVAPDDATLLKIDSTGQVATDSPYKKKIEELFERDPEAVKELKAIASLNALKAAQEALKLYLEEKKGAKNDNEEAAAYGRHMSLSLTIQKLANVMSFKDGKLSSAALDYVEALKPLDAGSSDSPRRG